MAKLTEADKLCFGMWKEAYLTVLPVLVAANPDGDPTRRASEIAGNAVTALATIIDEAVKPVSTDGSEGGP